MLSSLVHEKWLILALYDGDAAGSQGLGRRAIEPVAGAHVQSTADHGHVLESTDANARVFRSSRVISAEG
jgi:hypothetical protein